MTLININNVEIDTSEMDDLIAYVLSNCGVDGFEILTPKEAKGVKVEYGAIHFIKGLILDLPKSALDKLITASSDDELRDALGIVIDILDEAKSLTTVKSIFDVRMSKIANETLVAEILMENNYFGHEMLFFDDIAQTALKWADAFAYARAYPDCDEEFDFECLIDITADVKSGEIVIGPNRRIVQDNRGPSIRTPR